jgi:hypothetical protein
MHTTYGCLKCERDPAQFDDAGYSLCCGVYHDLDETTGELRFKPPTDPSGAKSSTYRGVTRVTRKTGRVTYRVQLTREGTTYYIGEFVTERIAAIVFDNAVYYLNLEGNFFRVNHTPALNFPEHYSDPQHVAMPFKSTQRLLRRLKTAHFTSLVKVATTGRDPRKK